MFSLDGLVENGYFFVGLIVIVKGYVGVIMDMSKLVLKSCVFVWVKYEYMSMMYLLGDLDFGDKFVF